MKFPPDVLFPGKLMLSLVRDMLEKCGLRESLLVFDAETNSKVRYTILFWSLGNSYHTFIAMIRNQLRRKKSR